jgi:hypothetical protein
MMTRAEKLFCIRAQVQKAASEIEHGDTYASCLALGDALSGVLRFLEEEIPEPASVPQATIEWPIHPEGERVKAPDVETRVALDTLRAEPTSFAGLPEEQQPFAGDPALAKQRKRK